MEELKALFLLDVRNVIEMDVVPPAMIINWDHTVVNFMCLSPCGLYGAKT